MADTQMLSKYLPKKLYNAAADADGTDLTAKEAMPEGRLTALETMIGDYTAKGADLATDVAAALKDIDDLEGLVGDYKAENTDIATDLAAALGDIDALQAVAPEYKATFASATAASKVLTVAATPGEGETVTIGTTAYKARLDALGTGVAATAILTSNTSEIADGDTVTIGTTVYRFKDTTAAAYDVKRHGTTADTTLGNLVKAVNASGTGDGTDYHAGTLVHPTVAAGEVTDHAITFTAKSVGFAGNAIAKGLSAGAEELDWDGEGEFFTGGIDAKANNDVFVNGSAQNFIINLEKAIEATGTNGTDYYFTTPAARTDVAVSAKDASTMTLTALTKGVSGNSIVIGETLSNGGSVWAGGATALSGGVNGQVGATGKIIFTADAVYCCTDGDKCTIADSSGWKSVALS